MTWPLSGQYRRISQYFGPSPDPVLQAHYEATGYDGHPGIDIPVPAGTEVRATHAGMVVIGNEPAGYGTYAYLIGASYDTLYAHLSSYAPARKVEAGEVIGAVGMTGYTTGAHLHFGVRPLPMNRENGYKGYVDPMPYLMGGGNMRLTLHEINRVDDQAWLQKTGAKAIKIMDPDVRGVPDFDGEIHGRLYFDHEADKALILKGFDGGVEYVRDWCAPRWAKAPGVDYWELWNEPEVRYRTSCFGLAQATLGAIQEAERLGKHVVIGNISVGQPEGDSAAINEAMRDLAPMYQAAIAGGHLGGYHAYWLPELGPQNQWTAHRYEILTDALERAGVYLPERFWVLNEAGIDLGIRDGDEWKGKGWKSAGYSEEQYWDEIVVFGEYAEWTRLVRWVSPFASGPTPDWEDFDFTGGLRDRAATYYQSHPWGDIDVAIPVLVPLVAGFTDLERTWGTGVAKTWPATMKYANVHNRAWCDERKADNNVDIILVSYAGGQFYQTRFDGHTWDVVAEERVV